MIRSTVVASIVVLWMSPVISSAQPPHAQRFEVASIKPSAAEPDSVSGITTGHGRVDAENVTLQRCIMGAYGVGPNQIAGGPPWLKSDRFEILAKADQPINSDAVLMLMLRELLAERFKLRIHRETRRIPAYVLELTRKPPKLEWAKGGEAVTNTTTGNAGVSIDAKNTDMDSFARILSRRMDRPVIDHTHLEGNFDIRLHWIPSDGGTAEEYSVFTAIQERLGLRLRPRNVPIEVIVIDDVQRPSEN